MKLIDIAEAVSNILGGGPPKKAKDNVKFTVEDGPRAIEVEVTRAYYNDGVSIYGLKIVIEITPKLADPVTHATAVAMKFMAMCDDTAGLGFAYDANANCWFKEVENGQTLYVTINGVKGMCFHWNILEADFSVSAMGRSASASECLRDALRAQAGGRP